KINVGLTFLVVNAFLIALLNSWTEQPLTFRPLSWIAIVIVVYAMIAPSTPRKMFVASMIAATMDPLGVWLAHRRGLPVPSAALNSPHTINLFDFGMTGEGTFYYVMELLAGRDLESLIREFGPLPAGRVIYLLRQACHSLADAHARGFVHRDIKPANIYVCRMGLEYDFVKVLDFGLVKVRDHREAGQTLLTADHGTTGTPAYMAPEIILGETDVDRRADVS